MSEEYVNETFPSYSPFWPLTILLAGFIIWVGFQDYQLNNQRSAFNQQFQAAIPTIQAAQNWQGRYNAMMQDLIQVGGKDPYAATIAKEAVQAGIQAGLIRVNQQQPGSAGTSTNGVTTPAAPDSSSK